MRRARLRGVSRRKWVVTTTRDRDAQAAPDLVQRQFTAAGPDQLWVADITYVPTGAGFLYLAGCSTRGAGGSSAGRCKLTCAPELVLAALDMAHWKTPGALGDGANRGRSSHKLRAGPCSRPSCFNSPW